jgi:hypothetical protein
VGIEERLEAVDARTLGLSQRWPARQEVEEENGIPLFEPVQGLGVILLEGVGQAVG